MNIMKADYSLRQGDDFTDFRTAHADLCGHQKTEGKITYFFSLIVGWVTHTFLNRFPCENGWKNIRES
jgi:hypothetical protein